MPDQHTIQVSTFGRDKVASAINEWIRMNPGWRVAAVHPLTIQKIGGPDTEALIVFEKQENNT